MKLFSKNEDEFKIFEQTKTENSFLIDSHKTTKFCKPRKMLHKNVEKNFSLLQTVSLHG